MIRLSNVIKSFDTKQGTLTAVDNVNLSIESGEIYGIIGYSGAGKSTLVRMFNGLEKPTKGEITLGDSVISKLTKSIKRKKTKNRDDLPTFQFIVVENRSRKYFIAAGNC